ncbi:FadR/GntR family transcriptional regulator [Rhodococcus opacus]|uniref:FadR/GntR family transcriptional regulator n=1 Tax=Rhodococcus opacus TaxID=37919 RepID=UPI001C492282|nr:GntR family transcriptional regulator [Rhodococcus opacus]MBV6760424.1 GntR family transcriptional regulator [Rhodococcus opacus]
MQQRKVSDGIIEALRRDIGTGKLASGTRLPTEKELARSYGVSQPTMREVIRALEVMGLVEVRHGSGAWVKGDAGYLLRSGLEMMLQMENASILQVLDMRGLLGMESARRAASAATEDDLAAVKDAYHRLDSTGDLKSIDEMLDALADFQVAVSRASHYSLLYKLEHFMIDLLLHLQMKAMRKRGVRFWQTRATSFQPDRRAILDALVDGDAQGAQDAMARFLQHQREVFVSDPNLAELRLADPRAVEIVGDLRYAGVRRDLPLAP